MGQREGDRKRAVILDVLKDYPEGLLVATIARKCRIHEPKLAQYHLRVLMRSGHVVRVKAHGLAFSYQLASEEESRAHNGT